MLLFRLRFPGFSPYFRPGFPCHLSGFVNSAFCMFPFVPSCFAPTAVPQAPAVPSVFRLPLRRFPLLPLTFVCFRLGSDYSALCFPFPSSRFSLTDGSFRCFYPHSLPPVTRLPFLLRYSAFLQFLSPLTVSHHRCYFSRRPPVSSSAAPLSFRLRFRLFGRVIHPEN